MSQSNGLALDRLLDNKESSNSVILFDSVNQSGNSLLQNFASRAAKDQPLVILCTETSPASFLKAITNGQNASIDFFDAYSNPNGWNDNVISGKQMTAGQTCQTVSDLSDFKSLVKGMSERINAHKICTVIIDSLSPLLLANYEQSYQLVRSITALATDQRRVIALHHTDITYSNNSVQHLPSLTDGLQRFFSVSVQLQPPPQTAMSNMAQLTGFNPVEQFSYMITMSNNTTALAKIMWKRKSGKILHETNAIRFDGQRVVVSSAIQDEEEPEDELEAPVAADPTANLSFNLTLTDEQRRAKEKLVLPYMKAQNRGVVEVDSGDRSGNVEPPSTGSIYYEPDAADDFDDEDPDEDLDI
ncbi:hypothetical protein INT43_005342 [Umbelopsis isabellina]|uniref:Elongator complex protein 5 n=1 Tax=Mortierella isabellina TaxID=91625 RepID=A0A8H7UE46_MORIS|nr:hypothetical protein INT43_005342 [Umbelopsis isabellina]